MAWIVKRMADGGMRVFEESSDSGCGGCCGGILLLVIGIFLLQFLFASLFSAFFNFVRLDTVITYGPRLYLANIVHFDRNETLIIQEGESFKAYEGIVKANELETAETVTTLKAGQRFFYRGFTRRGPVTWVAGYGYKGEDKVRFWIMLEEEWGLFKRFNGRKLKKSSSLRDPATAETPERLALQEYMKALSREIEWVHVSRDVENYKLEKMKIEDSGEYFELKKINEFNSGTYYALREDRKKVKQLRKEYLADKRVRQEYHQL